MSPEEKKLLRAGAKEVGVELSDAEIDRFDLFTAELLRWNAKLNLTSLRELTDVIPKHLVDSLSISGLLPVGARLLDIGSGGGFPCIPLKIARPDLDLVSVDSVQKKINFQRHVARLLGLEKFRAVHARVEELIGELGGSFDFVVARALADIAVLARMAMPFLADGGKLIAMKGGKWQEELGESAGEIDAMGLLVAETKELRLPIIGDVRGLVLLGRKNGPDGLKEMKLPLNRF